MDKKDINNKHDIIADDSNEEPQNKKLCVRGNVEHVLSQSKDKLNKQANAKAADTDDSNFKLNSKESISVDDQQFPQDVSAASDAVRSQSMAVVDKNVENIIKSTKNSPKKESLVSIKDSNANECTNRTDNKESMDCSNLEKIERKINFSDPVNQENAETNAEVEVFSATLTNVEESATAAANPALPLIRDKCVYGSQCYRTSEDHKSRFRHVGDPDYDIPDIRPLCPYGLNCYRKNPAHKQEFQHTLRPIRVQRPTQEGTSDLASETEYSTDEESVDESVYEPSLYAESSEEYRSEFDFSEKSDMDEQSDINDD